MPKKTTKKNIFDGYYKAVSGKDTEKNIRTRPTQRTGQPEAGVQADCLRWLKRRRIHARRNNTGFGDLRGTGQQYQYGIRDAGDLICCIDGKYVEIECKHGNGGVWKVNQQKHAEKVKQAGGFYFIVHSTQELAEAVEPLLTELTLFGGAG